MTVTSADVTHLELDSVGDISVNTLTDLIYLAADVVAKKRGL